MKIFLDLGHGGSDPGACANGLIEKNLNLTVGLKVKEILKANGLEVKCSREKDIAVGLDERCVMANNWGADYFVSIHHNAGGGDGYEIIHSIYHGKGEELAEAVGKEFNSTGQNCRNIYSKKGQNGDYFAIIRGTNMPAIITEYAFLDSRDVQAVDTVEELYNEAKAIANAILKFLNIKNNTNKEEVKADPYTIYRVQVGAFKDNNNAELYMKDLKQKGFDAFIVKVDGLYKVQVGAFAKKQNAINLKNKLECVGYKPFIV